MPRKSCPRPPDPTARKVAREHARRFHPADADVDDLEQEVHLARIERAPKYDPERGARGAYNAVVAKSRIRSLRERHYGREGRRAWRRSRGDDELTLRLTPAAVAERDVLLRRAIEQLVAGLDPHLQRVCTLLAADVARHQIAVDLGIARSTLHRHVQQLRQIFAEAGLDPSVLDR